VDQAFTWLGDAIVAHVDDERLDALEALAGEVGQPTRAEAVLSRALEEVFDGPLVRRLLARRAQLRRQKLSDSPGAAADLKRLHDLSPSDTAVMDELLELYTELRDYRGIVSLYEDQILRGKDPSQRAELARKVARVWEEELHDSREAADAWRRVLRMKAGDPEASEGLERAKALMLKRASEESARPSPSEVQASRAPLTPPTKSSPFASAEPIEAASDEPAEPTEDTETAVGPPLVAFPGEDEPSEDGAASLEDETIPGTAARMHEAVHSQLPPEPEALESAWNTDPAPGPIPTPSEPVAEETMPGAMLDDDDDDSAPAKLPAPPGGKGKGKGSKSRTPPAPPGRNGQPAPAAAAATTDDDAEEPPADVDDDELIDDRS
jgi:hypothetical protein